MSTPFQNRLVGTIIVAAISIIFLPDLLDGDKKTYQDEFEKIPQAPQIENIGEVKGFPKDKLKKLPTVQVEDELAIDDNINNTVEQTPADNNKNAQVKKLEKEQIITLNQSKQEKQNQQVKTLPTKAKKDTAWVIQLGSFRHKKNVEELVTKLKAGGYTAFTKPIKTKNGVLTKVFVGPELIKNSLEKKIPALKQLTNVQGKIARFTPSK